MHLSSAIGKIRIAILLILFETSSRASECLTICNHTLLIALRGMMGQVLAPRQVFLIDSLRLHFPGLSTPVPAPTPRPCAPVRAISTEAIFIFNNMLRKLSNTFKPVHMAAVFESVGPTLREQAFAEYKANRTEMPGDLAEQIPWIRRLIEAMRIPILQFPGFEADDVIGTLSCRAVEAGYDVVIVSSDKDMLQLVNSRVSACSIRPRTTPGTIRPRSRSSWASSRTKSPIYVALKGDAIDNIPGAPGIGDKGARDLIEQFGSVEAALDAPPKCSARCIAKACRTIASASCMSKQLAKIETNVPIEFSFADLEVKPRRTSPHPETYL